MFNKKGIILVTGAKSRIGSLVTQRFANEYQVIAIDKEKPAELPAKVEFIRIDFSSQDSLRQGFELIRKKHGSRLSSVIHLAEFCTLSKENSDQYDKVNVQGTARLVESLKDFQVEQLLFASTILVHLPCIPGQKINEDSPHYPKWTYPKSKDLAEKIIRKKNGHTSTVILRIAPCYDEEHPHILITHQINRIYKKKLSRYFFPGNSTHGLPFLHYHDLLQLISLLVEKRRELPHEFELLVGEDKTLSYDHLQRNISRLLTGKEFSTYQMPKWFAKTWSWLAAHLPFGGQPFLKPWMVDFSDDHYELNISRATDVLGWKPNHFIGKSLPIMTQHAKGNK